MKATLLAIVLWMFTSLSLAQVYRPNLVINGDMQIDQRNAGAAVACAAADTFGPDRFACFENAATGAMNVQQQSLTSSDSPYLNGIQKSVRIIATTGFSAGAAERSHIYTKIEGYDFAAIAKKTATLSFWVRAKKTGAACVAIRNSVSDRSYIIQYTIAAADTWQEVSSPINFSTGTASGTWNYTNGIGVSIGFTGNFGTDYDDGTNGAWVSTDERGTTACQTNNLLSAINDYIEVTGVRLTDGALKVPFFRAGGGTIEAELLLAQRYYSKSYLISTVPGAVSAAGSVSAIAYSTTNALTSARFPVRMKAAPTVTCYNPSGTSAKMRQLPSGTAYDCTASNISDIGFGLISTSGVAAADNFDLQFTAESEL